MIKPEAVCLVKEALLARLRDRVVHLILHVTRQCNFRCAHCFIDFSKAADDLSLAEIKTVAESVNDLLWLDIGGGEPFLREDLKDIVPLFHASEVSIPSNGYLTDRILAGLRGLDARMDLQRLILTLSLDGLAPVHDRLRGKPGSFERTVGTFFALRQAFPGLRVKFNTVLTNRNLEDILPLMRFVQERLAPDFHSLLFLRGSPNDPNCRLPEPEQIEALEAEVKTIQDGYGYGRSGLLARVQRRYQSLKRRLDEAILARKTQVTPCLAGRAHLVVYADGEVAPCEILPTVGSIRKTPLAQVLTGEDWRKATAAIRAKRCHCTHDCNMIENILFDFRNYPELLLGRPRSFD